MTSRQREIKARYKICPSLMEVARDLLDYKMPPTWARDVVRKFDELAERHGLYRLLAGL